MTNAITAILEQVGKAREDYQARYTMGQLKALDPDLYQALRDQDDEFTVLVVAHDSEAEIVDFGKSTIRGWHLALDRMTAAAEPEGVFSVGICGKTNTAVVISENKRTLDRMRDQYPHAVHMTPDEVAVLVGGLGAVADVKRKFNGSEITRAETNGEEAA